MSKLTGKYILVVKCCDKLCVVFDVCQIAPYKCEPCCNQMFPYPLKYIQHIAGRLHKLFIKSLAIHPSTSTQMKRLDFLIQKHQKIYVRRDFNIENEAEDIAARRHFRGDERLIRLGKALEVIFLFLRRSSLLAGKQSAHPML